METGLIRQRIVVRAPAKAVYEALTDARRHAKLIGAQASIQGRPGGAFSMWDGWCSGTTLALVPGKKVVQAWRCEAKGWPKGHFSRLTYALAPAPGGGTALTLTQADVPVACIPELKQGWHDSYWAPMKRQLEGRA